MARHAAGELLQLAVNMNTAYRDVYRFDDDFDTITIGKEELTVASRLGPTAKPMGIKSRIKSNEREPSNGIYLRNDRKMRFNARDVREDPNDPESEPFDVLVGDTVTSERGDMFVVIEAELVCHDQQWLVMGRKLSLENAPGQSTTIALRRRVLTVNPQWVEVPAAVETVVSGVRAKLQAGFSGKPQPDEVQRATGEYSVYTITPLPITPEADLGELLITDETTGDSYEITTTDGRDMLDEYFQLDVVKISE